MIRIVIVEHNANLPGYFAFNLQQAGYEVKPLPDGAVLDAWLVKCEADLLVFDSDSPCGEGGGFVPARLRQARPKLGIVMLANQGSYDERVQCLEQGADAYLTKPVDIRELLAVIRAVARRLDNTGGVPLTEKNSRQQSWSLVASQLELVAPAGKRIPLSHNEFCVLQAAARAKGNLLNRKTLIEALGKNYLHYDERCLETLMSRLRRKLSSTVTEGFPLRAVRGHGYLFGAELREVQEEA